MSLLSDYRTRIKTLLAAEDIQTALELEGVSAVGARAIGVSRAVIAQRSIGKNFIEPILDKGKPAKRDCAPAEQEDQ